MLRVFVSSPGQMPGAEPADEVLAIRNRSRRRVNWPDEFGTHDRGRQTPSGAQRNTIRREVLIVGAGLQFLVAVAESDAKVRR